MDWYQIAYGIVMFWLGAAFEALVMPRYLAWRRSRRLGKMFDNSRGWDQ